MSRVCLMFALLCAGCSAYKAPSQPAPRDATEVSAPTWRTWDAVVDVFAARNIPIRRIERVAGVVVAEELSIGPEGRDLADCGKLNGDPLSTDHAIYNVLVRGDSITSSVKTSVRWLSTGSGPRTFECSTSYSWERGFEADVKSRAEIRALAAYGGPAADLAATPPGHSQTPAPDAATSTASAATSTTDATEASAGHSAPPAEDLDPVPGTRPNNVLLSFEGFRRAVGDMQRKGLLLRYREVALERLQVDLTATAFGEPTLEYQLTRLFLAYGATMNDDIQPTLSIRADGQQVGLYTRAGLQWDAAAGRR